MSGLEDVDVPMGVDMDADPDGHADADPDGHANVEAVTATVGSAEAPSAAHSARARSAYERAVATCHHAGVGPHHAEVVPKDPTGRAAHALQLAARSIESLGSGTPPDPAAAARCARNAAATAALAAQVAHALDDSAPSHKALRAALTASQAAAAAAGARTAGRDATLNAGADDAERLALTAAREAGWIH
ncbi:hypothetical protein SGFS_060010 [Streptomyces graminofaciens]|uniref:Uncharacterized protein n=1 Tax=Streptomyces graminofaciens TaxID=68212 RepID=A0ABN5VML6_9ACTN|nr:hypothetical protein [Streptomyces graminofaciens]BBC34707.1 hypothetical protein SGFS_060010 [Streptomyces graminofaciens]